jgi:Lrp/AsnC family leucine-responsive transcriptional regulator
LAEVNGAWAVYYVLGDIDFIVVIRAHDRDDYMRKLNEIFNVGDIERTTTHIVARVFKDPILDPTVPI